MLPKLLIALTLTCPLAGWAQASAPTPAPAHAPAAPVGEALQRPALQVRQPQRVVLMAAALAGQRIVVVGERGVIALSDDQGSTWRQAPVPVSTSLAAVRFADATHGVAVGHGGTVLTTTDAGSTWVLRLDGRRVATLAREAARTETEVRDADRLLADGPDKPFLDVLMFDRQRMLAVGGYGIAFHSADGGVSWTPWMARLPNPKGLHWYVARQQGQRVLLAGEQGALLVSDDGGTSFKPLASPYAGSWFAGEFADSGLVLGGLRGNVWRTLDGAANWEAVSKPHPASITAMARAGDGSILLATQAGVVMRLQGDKLVPLQGAPIPAPSGLLPLADGRLLAVGVAGVVLVAAGGPSGPGAAR